MPAINRIPESFEIEAASPDREPETESYIVRMRLRGMYQVRSFLSDNGVNDKTVVFAIEELARSGHVKVSNDPFIGQRRRRAA